MLEIRLGDRFLGLDRVHEAQDRLRQRRATSRTSAIEATS